MKKPLFSILFTTGERLFPLFVAMFTMLSPTASAESYTKTYDFRSIQYYDYNTDKGTGYFILPNNNVWGVRNCSPEIDNGLLLRNVSEDKITIETDDRFYRITRISVKAGAAPGSNAGQEEVLTYIAAGNSSPVYMKNTSKSDYNNRSANMVIYEYSFDVNILDGIPRITLTCGPVGPADFLLQEVTVTYEVAEPEVKTYDFTSCQYEYDERLHRNFIKIPGESRVWQMRPKFIAAGDSGLLIQGVTNNTVYLDAQEKYREVANITIKAAVAPNASAGSDDVSAYICSPSTEGMKLTPKSVYQDNAANLVIYEYSFDCSQAYYTPVIGFRAGSEPVDFLIKEISITYQGVVNESSISIDTESLNEQNISDVKGDGTVSFDGKRRLTLKNAKIQSLFYGIPELEIVLIGENTLESEYRAFSPNVADPVGVEPRRLNLITLMTDGIHPGSLTLTRRNKTSVPTNFEEFISQDVILNLRDNLVGTFVNDDTTPYALISLPLHPILTQEGEREVDYSRHPGDVGTKELTNVVIDNVLYTLHDTQQADVSDDGFDQTRGMVVLNTAVSESDVQKASRLVPGTERYAQQFKGLTFMVPAGVGEIALTAVTNGDQALHVKVGNQPPHIIRTGGDLRSEVIPYSCSAATYVYIYHADGSQQGAPDHRIGPKPTVSTGVTGVKVSAFEVDTPPSPSQAYLSLKKGDVQWPQGGKGHIVVSDSKVTVLDDDAFEPLTAAAPRRAASDYDITYIDLRATGITGREFSREQGAFKNLPLNTFVYLPAGNTAQGKNIVVGSVCDELDVASGEKSFDAPAPFTATQATVRRTFPQGEKTPVCLPFSLRQPTDYGTFYVYGGMNGGKVQMYTSPQVAANTGYYLEPAAALTSIDATNVLVKGSMQPAASEGVVGSFEKTTAFGPNAYYYDNASQTFKPLDASAAVFPFGAWLQSNGSAASLPVEWGAGTAIRSVSAQTAHTDACWYTLDGRRLQQRPTRPGLYIHQGKKVLLTQ